MVMCQMEGCGAECDVLIKYKKKRLCRKCYEEYIALVGGFSK